MARLTPPRTIDHVDDPASAIREGWPPPRAVHDRRVPLVHLLVRFVTCPVPEYRTRCSIASMSMQSAPANFREATREPLPASSPTHALDARPDAFHITRREVALVIAFWTLFALVTFANRALDPRRPSLEATIWIGSISISLVQAMSWAAFTFPLFLLVARFVGTRERRVLRAVMILTAMVVAAVLVGAMVDVVRDSVLPIPSRGSGRVPRAQRWWSFSVGGFQFINDIVIAMGVVAAGFARAYSLSSQARMQQAALLQAQLAEAKLEALRRQLDPHFLFNTLHAVSSLVERDPRGVRRMISRLSELLRYSIDGANVAEVTLRQELELLQRYVEIMQIRFQGRLVVATHADPEFLDALVPNMILQPLVENAVKHGVESMTTVGQIDIEVERRDDELILRVRDNGTGLTDANTSTTPTRGAGVGIRNIVARLEQLYGAEHAFELRADDTVGTVAEVRLPFHTASDLRTTGLSTSDRNG